ncbi:MAG TPA: phage tail sheath C-terminal domain-containing protein [Acidimicrobiia bacterium]|nr:phage tail sheath C-terminal domain-containing protein [Acidimicrobiia bacterium]
MSTRVRTITGVATSIAAFIGRASRGPVDDPRTVTSFVDFERVFGGFWAKSNLGYSVGDFFAQGGKRAIVVRVHQPADGHVARLRLGTGAGRIVLEAASPGSWGSRLTATIEGVPGSAKLFHLTLTDRGSGIEESYRRVSLRPRSPRRLDRVLEQSDLVRVHGALPTALPESLPLTAAGIGGNDGGRLAARNFTRGTNMRRRQKGLYALDRVDLVNLIVIPPYSAGGVASGVIADTVVYAEERGAMLIMDPPPPWRSIDDAVAGASTPSFPTSPNAAVYFPRIRRPDPLRGDQVRDFAPAGAVAGVIARTDENHGVWSPPAGPGATLTGVTGLTLSLDDRDQGRLNPIGVNCLRTFPPANHVVWGARTRAGADGSGSEWKYLMVRRTALFLEQSIELGTKWALFEPNEETTWSRIRLEVGNFLHDLYRKGAFVGITPRDGYFVKCDSSTTTRNDIKHGMLNIVVGFAPVRPAEFVLIRIGQKSGEGGQDE